MKILAACDLTARSRRALARSFMLARDLDANLHILHIVDKELPVKVRDYSIEWANKELAEAARELSGSNPVPQIDVRTGDPAREIAAEAANGSTDLIVFGAGHRSSDQRDFAETTAGRVLKQSFAAALLVTSEPSEPYKRVVVGTDLSAYSRTAIRQASQVAPTAQLSFVHAYQLPFEGLLGRSTSEAVAKEQRVALETFLKEEMASLESRTETNAGEQMRFESIIEEGRPHQVLRAVCQRTGADLLAIGTHSRPDISRMIWGSVATDLFNNPPCDVLVTSAI